MKSDYLVSTELPNSLGVSAFILAANYHSPFECLEEISQELDRQSVKGLLFLIFCWRMALKLIDIFWRNSTERNLL